MTERARAEERPPGRPGRRTVRYFDVSLGESVLAKEQPVDAGADPEDLEARRLEAEEEAQRWAAWAAYRKRQGLDP